jgi:hypothetical protein
VFRDAQLTDRTAYLDLFTQYIEELKLYGGELEADLETLRSARSLFDSYVNGEMAGVCVLFDPPGEGLQGFTLVGASGGIPMFPKRKFGRLAQAWAIYLQPKWRSRNVAQDIWVNTGKKLLALGFDTLIGDILVQNKVSQVACAAVGWEPHSVNYAMNLKEWKNGTGR